MHLPTGLTFPGLFACFSIPPTQPAHAVSSVCFLSARSNRDDTCPLRPTSKRFFCLITLRYSIQIRLKQARSDPLLKNSGRKKYFSQGYIVWKYAAIPCTQAMPPISDLHREYSLLSRSIETDILSYVVSLVWVELLPALWPVALSARQAGDFRNGL